MKKEAIEYSRLVRMFCTPPPYPLSEGEMNALKKAEPFTVRFEGWDLPCYSWGEGRTVLLCHGWGSRAGHLTLLARALARAGYRAVAFDAPAHHSMPVAEKKQKHHVSNLAPSPIRRGTHRHDEALRGIWRCHPATRGGAGVRSNPSLKIQIPDHKHQIPNSNDPIEERKNKETSNMFEFGRAISHVARSLGDVYGVFGHSLGAMASLFAMTAYPHLQECAFSCRKLILASAPATLHHVIFNFCRKNSLNESERLTLEEELSAAFAMIIENYDCAGALKTVPTETLIIQDADDEEFAAEETLVRAVDHNAARVLVTEKLGHNRILANKQVFTEIIDFLKP